MSNLIYREDSFSRTINFTRPNNESVYSARDAISDSIDSPSCITFMGATGAKNQYVVLTDVTVRVKSVSTAPNANLYIFNSIPIATSDNAPLSISDNDMIDLETIVKLEISFDYGDSFVLHSTNLNDRIKPNALNANFYGLLQTTSSFKPIANDVISIKICGYHV